MGTIHHYNIRQQIAAATQALIRVTPGVNGPIREIMMHFPNGCDALVWIRVRAGNAQLFPFVSTIVAENFIALNDAVNTWVISRGEKVNRNSREYICPNETLEIEINNFDAANPHTPTIVISIEDVGGTN